MLKLTKNLGGSRLFCSANRLAQLVLPPKCALGSLRRFALQKLMRPTLGKQVVRMTYWLAGLLVMFSSLGQCQAGLTSTEVVLAVNGGSLNSRTLANHYVRLRGIPSINVIVLESVPSSEVITIDVFRESILKPLVAEISKRGLAGHVQCIAYSADFPTAIDIKKEIASIKGLQEIFTPMASINGLTFLYELALAGNPAYITPDANYYARRSMESYFSNPGGAIFEASWKGISGLIAKGKHEEALKKLTELSQSLPHQYPLKYLAAAEACLANQPQQSVQLLEEAINGGWTSGGYLANDKRFDALRQRMDFQVLELSLDRDPGKWQPTMGFNHRTFWAPNGVRFLTNQRGPVPGIRYLLSTVLGVTRGPGNSLKEAIECLKRASTADFTHPDGGFYFSDTSDIRTQTRKPLFEDAVAELNAMGFAAEVVRTPMPMQKPAVLGAQLGTPQFDWSKSSSTLVAGSLVDNLTSYGGVMSSSGGQTKLTEAFKWGAAGSSGTVTEPYSLQFKFPDPYLFVHYAKGSSLAEAFYQSVTGPYQLLIVGDPLCQPFSIAPQHKSTPQLQRLAANESLRIEIDVGGPKYSDWLQMSAPPSQRKVALAPARFALQVDGGSPTSGAVQPVLQVGLAGLAAGYHEVHMMLIADDPLNQRTSNSFPVWIGPADSMGLTIKNASGPAQPTEASSASHSDLPQVSLQAGSLVIEVRPPAGCQQISLWHHYEQLQNSDVSEASEVQWQLPFDKVGMGPVRLQAKAKLPDGTEVAGPPHWIEVIP